MCSASMFQKLNENLFIHNMEMVKANGWITNQMYIQQTKHWKHWECIAECSTNNMTC